MTRRSRGRGYYEDTSARTPARSPSAALTAAKRSPTDRTCERTFRHIPPPRTTSASDANASSRSSPTSTSTAARQEAAPPCSYRQTRTCPPDVALLTTTAVDQRLLAAHLTTICQRDSVLNGPTLIMGSMASNLKLSTKMVKRVSNFKA